MDRKRKIIAAGIFIFIGALILAFVAWLESESSSFELTNNTSNRIEYQGKLTGTSWVNTGIEIPPNTKAHIDIRNYCGCQLSAKLGSVVQSTDYGGGINIESSEGGKLMLKKTKSTGLFSRDDLDIEVWFQEGV